MAIQNFLQSLFISNATNPPFTLGLRVKGDKRANAGMNPKALQYIMGHANIAMTLNYYAHATFDSAMAEMKRLNKEKQQERLVA